MAPRGVKLIDRSAVHRNLDSKIKILGMELFDVIGVGVFASMMNLLFGQTQFAGALVFGLPTLLVVIIYFGKKGKPERYLQDFIKFLILPGVFCVGDELRFEEQRRQNIVIRS